MSKSVQCLNCKATYHFDNKKWVSFICEICKTFIHNKTTEDMYKERMNDLISLKIKDKKGE